MKNFKINILVVKKTKETLIILIHFFPFFRAKNMSSMAFAMYQFTKGEGRLNTTQDLFTQAEYFAEEANRLYKIVRQFSYQV